MRPGKCSHGIYLHRGHGAGNVRSLVRPVYKAGRNPGVGRHIGRSFRGLLPGTGGNEEGAAFGVRDFDAARLQQPVSALSDGNAEPAGEDPIPGHRAEHPGHAFGQHRRGNQSGVWRSMHR